MLNILQMHLDRMWQQAIKDHPIETCGIIAGKLGSNEASRFIPMKNIAQSTSFFEFDPKEQLQVWREMEVNDEEPIVIFHSHTHSEAYPSPADCSLAMEPNAHYVIISTQDKDLPDADHAIRSFRIMNGEIVEERIARVASYQTSVA